MSKAIEVHNISKLYRLGAIGTGSLVHDLNRWWKTMRGQEDPYQLVGQVNDRSQKATSPYVWALKDISFSVNEGEVIGIIGKNGAGKSTLLKILSRITSPSQGEIRIKGRIASLLEVGTGFHPELSGRENIFLNGAILGMRKKEIKAKLDEIIDFSGVERYIDTPVKRYSSGMYVRLAFGVAAHLDPEILVIDEVLAVGDAEFQKKCIGKMQDVSRSEGRTVLFVSHNMAAVKSLCTQSIVLKNGMVDFEKGDTELAIQHYIRAEISASKILLRNRKDRSGRGRIQFTAVEYLNGAGEIVPSLISGEKAEIRAYYQNPEQFESINNKIEVSITHPEGIILIQFNNFLKNFPLKLNHKEGYVSVHIDRLPVSGGQYFINLLVFSNDLLEDWVIHAGSLLVEEGDYYGFGVSSLGIKADHTWEEN